MRLADGYTDLAPGKIANVATYLEMFARPPLREQAPGPHCTLHRVQQPEPRWYRTIFRRVGEQALWFSRLLLTDEQLHAIICNPLVEIYAVRHGSAEIGLLELDFREPEQCELVFFGLAGEYVGTGIGRWLMNRAIELAWAKPISRFWVHTCTLDHPGALAFYERSGFRAYARKIEVADDPRLTGVLPRTAAPHIPIIEE